MGIRFHASGSAVAVLTILVVVVLSFAGWVTHCATQIVRLIHGSPDDAMLNALILVGGALFAPIGVVHGWLIWFGLA